MIVRLSACNNSTIFEQISFSLCFISASFTNMGNWKRVFGTATRVWVGLYRVQNPTRARDSSLLQNIPPPPPTLGPNQPPMQAVPRSLPGLKRPGREIDPSILSSADVENEWSYTCTSLYAFIVRTGTKLHLPFFY
jgi:hypothetical protein